MSGSLRDAASPNIYTPEFVRALFDEMSATYGPVNLISSFGFCVRWRRQCVARAGILRGDSVCDLMAGMGELWPEISRLVGDAGQIRAVDISPVMCERSKATAARLRISVDIRLDDALRSGVPDEAANVIVSSFGLKTFNRPQQQELAVQIARILKPAGRFSLLEISVPGWTLVRVPYLFYLRWVIPVIGRLFLGNPENYRWLGVYTRAFRNCDAFVDDCRQAGLTVRRESFFLGCATGVTGEKPTRSAVDC